MDRSTIDILWLVVASGLVFLMQAGFLCLETGLTRSKNNINVAIKNVADFAVSTLLFWMFGYGFMFGLSASGFIGTDSFFLEFGDETAFTVAFFIFQAMFCGTAVTILSGAIAERVRFFAYIAFSVIIGGLIYPIAGHWSWNGNAFSETTGWLAQMGFVDFAGSTIVHSVGGWASLAVLLIVGARHGRFNKDDDSPAFMGSNLPIAALGVLLLYIGWIGFNGGSNLALNAQTITIIANTLMAGAAGAIAPTLFSFIWDGITRIDGLINGVLSGLVAITASVFAVNTANAVIIGLIGGVIMSFVTIQLERWKIDDAIGAIPVHLGAGIWGTIAVGIFGDLDVLGTGLTRGEQIGVQILGVVVYGVWTFGVMYLFTWFMNRYTPIRVSIEEEKTGLNYTEHGVRDPWVELIEHMDGQVETKNWLNTAHVEPFTTAGRVAEHYNIVLNALNQVINNSNAIIDRAMDGIITFSQNDLSILTVNPAAEIIFGCTKEDVLQQPITQLLRTNQSTQNRDTDVSSRTFKPILQEAAQTDYPVELIGRRANGTRFPVEVTLVETENDNEHLYVGTFRDITLRTKNREELESARDAAEASNRSKSAFLANMSHELRTPLNAILGYSEILMEDIALEGVHHFGTDIEKIQTAGRHLLDLINNVLDLSKIEAGHTGIYLEKIDLNLLLTEIKVTMQPLVMRNGNEFELALPQNRINLHTDAVKLKQILINLISNAAKFTHDGSVSLSYSVEQINDQQWITFYISDTGIGISSSEITYLFEPFTQADLSTTRKYGGTGLGLAITKRFCELLGGKIEVNSEIGRGSTFSVQIPVQYDDTHKNTSQNELKPSQIMYDQDTLAEKRNIILVIDDDPAALDLITHHLVREGFHAEQASNGAEGLRKAKQLLPSLITLDVNMPDMDGWTVLSELKHDHELKNIPVILLTIAEERATGFALGASDFLTKPIQKDQLLSAINRIARFKSTEDNYILLVEDDEMVRDVVQRTLEKDNWTVETAANGRLAIETLQSKNKPPTLILLDLMMPEVDGFMFVDIIRLNKKWREIPIIVVTSKDLTGEERTRLNGGVDEILQKGGQDLNRLLSNIRAHINTYTDTDKY